MTETVGLIVCGVAFYCLGYRTGRRDERAAEIQAREIEAELDRQKKLRGMRAQSNELGRVPEDA